MASLVCQSASNPQQQQSFLLSPFAHLPSAPFSISNGQAEYDSLVSFVSGPYRAFLVANAGFVIVSFPLMLFLIVCRSPPEMSKYVRNLFLNSVLICFLYAIWQAIFQQIHLYPLFIGFSNGIFNNSKPIFTVIGSYIRLWLLSSLAVNYSFAFVHYYSLIHPAFILNKHLNNCYKRMLAAHAVAHILNLIICALMVYADMLPMEEMRQQMTAFPADSFECVLFNSEPSLAPISTSKESLLSKLVFKFWLFSQVILVVLLNIKIVIGIKRMDSDSLPAAYQTITFAYRVFLFKSLFLLLLFYIPDLILSFAVARVLFSSYYLSIGCNAVMTVHSAALYVHLMLTVKPYRVWLFGLLKKMANRKRSGAIVQPSKSIVLH